MASCRSGEALSSTFERPGYWICLRSARHIGFKGHLVPAAPYSVVAQKMGATMPLIEVRSDAVIGTIILDHPKKRNALSKQLVDTIVETLARFSKERIRVVVLRAQPAAKVWSAGHDVGELPEGGRDPLGWDDPLRYLVRSIEEFPAPVIASIEGGVWGEHAK